MRASTVMIAVSFMGLAVLTAVRASVAQTPSARPVTLVDFEGTVNPGSADYVIRALQEAPGNGSQAVVIRLDTPGGMVDSTREIVKAQLASTVPVVVWVGPAGARAGSAGVFITLAANLAAMAPATNIGAAHPVGGGIEKKDDIMSEKATNDLVALAQSIANQRGRNADWAAKAVRESAAVSADEALKLKVVDLIAPDLPSLLKSIDGKEVQTSAGKTTLATLSAPVIKAPMSLRERVLDTLGDPTIAALLMGLGMLGIFAELYHPGTLIPGVVGAVCLALGLLGTRTLPVRLGAIVLLLVGGALIAAEFFVSSFGLLAVAGLICLGLGAFLLIDPSKPGYLVDWDFGVDWSAVLPVLLTVGLFLAIVVWKVTAARLAPETTGAGGLVGEEGKVVAEVGPTAGKIHVHGELWEARSSQPIAEGRRVRVEKVAGLVTTVAPVEPS